MLIPILKFDDFYVYYLWFYFDVSMIKKMLIFLCKTSIFYKCEISWF